MNFLGKTTKSLGNIFHKGSGYARNIFSSGIDGLQKVAPIGAMVATGLGHPEVAAGLITAAKYGGEIKKIL